MDLKNVTAPRARAVVPWLCFLSCWALFELPAVVAADGIHLAAIRLTGEALVLWTLYWVSPRIPMGRPLRWGGAAFASLLWVIRVDRAVFHVLSRAEPLFYDQLFMLRHAYVLVSDLTGMPILVSTLALAVLVAVPASLVRALVRGAAPLFATPLPMATRNAGAALWALAFVSPIYARWTASKPIVVWMTGDIVRNVVESRKVYRAVERGLHRSPYAAYEKIRLSRRPDVFLFFVESYGRLITRDPSMRPDWLREVSAIEFRLGNSGWHARSGYSTAPVSGGRSWLAVGSIFTGTKVQYEAEFRQLVQGPSAPPTLVQFLRDEGYDTFDLAPSDRARPGVERANPYGYAHLIGFDELDYHGRKMGWGTIPDQYSLGYTEEHYLVSAHHPLFFHFHMVSSHAPWSDVPDGVANWHELNDGTKILAAELRSNVLRPFKNYARLAPSDSYMGGLTSAMREGYTRSVVYDLRVLEEFISRQTGDALVIVMGDHQPPVVAPDNADFDVPVHVLAKDPVLLRQFADVGFSEGLALTGDEPAHVEHAGLFSLWVRTLVRSSGTDAGLPPFLPKGVALED